MSDPTQEALTHYHEQARLAQFERMREALKSTLLWIKMFEGSHNDCTPVECAVTRAKEVYRDVEGL